MTEKIKKEEFYKVYANLPINLREEVVLVLDGQPISWQVAKLEIDGDTSKGETILEKLTVLEFI